MNNREEARIQGIALGNYHLQRNIGTITAARLLVLIQISLMNLFSRKMFSNNAIIGRLFTFMNFLFA